MNISLAGKCAIVSGSTQGIGKAAALQLARQGARIILIARNEAKLKETVAELEKISANAHAYYVADFHDSNQVKGAVKAILDEQLKVEILVNNTGGPAPGLAIDATVDQFKQAFEMHLICNHILVQGFVRDMMEARYGRIINVISTSVKQPLPNLGVSNTIRGAVANWSKTLANELGKYGVTVNNVLPGATDTSRLRGLIEEKAENSGKNPDELLKAMGAAAPMGRVGLPEEIANAIGFLASPAASFISGINLPVDGGRTSSL